MTLEAKGISFRYRSGARLILNRVELSVESGERVGLVAPSGFGKTTLCKVLSGYERPESGRVLLDGRPLERYRGRCPVQMIWQHPQEVLNPRLPVGRALLEGGGVEARIVHGLGIEEEWLPRFPGELSGGELQRFSIARALGQGTRFLLADEISAMLDLITQSQIWTFLLAEAEAREIGMLVISHSEDLLERVCTRRVDLEDFA